MTNIKTAISIEQPLFEELEALANEMDISRSRLLSLAAREFIQSHKNKKLLDDINAAYSPPESNEEKLTARMKSKQLGLVKEQW